MELETGTVMNQFKINFLYKIIYNLHKFHSFPVSVPSQGACNLVLIRNHSKSFKHFVV